MLDLPAPFGPISAVEAPRRDLEADVVERPEARELQRHALDTQPERATAVSTAPIGASCGSASATRSCAPHGRRRDRTPARRGCSGGRRSVAVERDAAALEDVAVVRELERDRGVLLDEQHRRAEVAAHVAEALEDELDHAAARARARPRRAAAGAAGTSAPARPRPSAARRRRATPPSAAAARAGRGNSSKILVERSRRRCPFAREAPTRRFSSTVSCRNTSRPSGTWPTPRATIVSGGEALDRSCRRGSISPSRIDPSCRPSRPETARMIDVLPAPFGPSSATTPPSGTLERDAADGERDAVDDLDVVDGEQRAAAGGRRRLGAAGGHGRAHVV